MSNISMLTRTKFPEVGDKVKFLGADRLQYPHYTNIIDIARKNLVVGEIYTIEKVTLASSWCGIYLEEFKSDKPVGFNLSMFEFPIKSDTVLLEEKLKNKNIGILLDLAKSKNEIDVILQSVENILKDYKLYKNALEQILSLVLNGETELTENNLNRTIEILNKSNV